MAATTGILRMAGFSSNWISECSRGRAEQFFEVSGPVSQQISILLASKRLLGKISRASLYELMCYWRSTYATFHCKPSIEVCAARVFTWRDGSLSNSNTYCLRSLSASKAGNKYAEMALLGREWMRDQRSHISRLATSNPSPEGLI